MKVCVCTVIKDETEYLEDWVKYTLNIGVDKIYITEDFGSQSHQPIVEKYADKVEILSLPYDSNEIEKKKIIRQSMHQSKMFEYIRNSGEYDWCMIIDVDEYITINEKNTSLKELLSQYEDYSEILLYWKNYGANGHIEKPDYTKVGSYRKYYTKESKVTHADKKYAFMMKKAINLHKISPNYRVSQHHPSMSTYTKTNFQHGIYTPCFDKVYLAHYITKSWEEYVWKLQVRGMCYNNHRKLDDFFEINPDMVPLKEHLLSKLN